MGINTKKFENYLYDWMESPEGKEHFEIMKKKKEIQEGRYRRFEKYLETHDFDKLMYKLILEHGEQWQEKCWHNGCEMYPNNKLEFVIEYISNNHEQIIVPQLDCNFPNHIWLFKGYYFQIVYGQGSAVNIYNADDFSILLRV